MPDTKTVEQIVNELLKIRLDTDFRDIERRVSAPWTSIGTPLIRDGDERQDPSASCNADGGRLAPSTLKPSFLLGSLTQPLCSPAVLPIAQHPGYRSRHGRRYPRAVNLN